MAELEEQLRIARGELPSPEPAYPDSAPTLPSIEIACARCHGEKMLLSTTVGPDGVECHRAVRCPDCWPPP
jgi:hypothetical protein